jgi:hypothetical protein
LAIEVKPSEYKIEGLNVKEFFDERFIKLLEERIENIRYLHSCFAIYGIKEGEEKESMIERIVIGHETKEDESYEITTIGSTKSETCQILLEVVKEYLKQKEEVV